MRPSDTNDILQRFGEKVRSYRKNLGISQERLAEISGLHRTYIGSIERGEQNISLKNIVKVAHALGISPAALLQEDE